MAHPTAAARGNPAIEWEGLHRIHLRPSVT